MTWKDTPENRAAFIADVARMLSMAGGVQSLVDEAVTAWQYVNDNMHVNPAGLKRKELEQAYINAMHAAWHLARLSYAVNGSLLDGSDARSYNAAKGGKAKLLKNPEAAEKAAAKASALELWKERNAGKHPRLRTVEQFAMEVMRRWPVLKSSRVICDWSADWTKQAKAGKDPVC